MNFNFNNPYATTRIPVFARNVVSSDKNKELSEAAKQIAPRLHAKLSSQALQVFEEVASLPDDVRPTAAQLDVLATTINGWLAQPNNRLPASPTPL